MILDLLDDLRIGNLPETVHTSIGIGHGTNRSSMALFQQPDDRIVLIGKQRKDLTELGLTVVGKLQTICNNRIKGPFMGFNDPLRKLRQTDKTDKPFADTFLPGGRMKIFHLVQIEGILCRLGSDIPSSSHC